MALGFILDATTHKGGRYPIGTEQSPPNLMEMRNGRDFLTLFQKVGIFNLFGHRNGTQPVGFSQGHTDYFYSPAEKFSGSDLYK